MSKKVILIVFLSMVLLGTAFAQQMRPPQQLRIENAYQREADLLWNKSLQTDIEWEIRLEGFPPMRTTDVRYTLEKLEPDTEYTVKVRMVKGNEHSAFSTLKFKTKPLNFKVDSPQRVPYLRSIRIDAVCSRELPLYYTDLANSDAHITYKLNGNAVEPIDNRLILDTPNYTDKLEVLIDEGDNRQFRLIYFVNVSKDN